VTLCFYDWHGAESLRGWKSLGYSRNSLLFRAWRFTAVFTKACHWTLSWARWVQSTSHSHSFKIHFDIIHPSRCWSPKWYLCSGFLCKSLYASLISQCMKISHPFQSQGLCNIPLYAILLKRRVVSPSPNTQAGRLCLARCPWLCVHHICNYYPSNAYMTQEY